jgi:hypothetical protein
MESPIPNQIDLDGYCTSMEDNDGEDEDKNDAHDGLDYSKMMTTTSMMMKGRE